MPVERKCYVICPFGPPDSNARKRSDLLLELVIKRALEELGYLVDRADLEAHPGVVTTHVIQHLIEDDLIVADISDLNPNVFYELAIRHAIRKPYVQFISHGQAIPFNIQEIQTIIYDVGDIGQIKHTIDILKKQVLYYHVGGKVTSPVTVAIDEMLGTRSLAQFSEMLHKLQDLDKGITKAGELGNKIEEVRNTIVSLKTAIEALPRNTTSTTSQADYNYKGSESQTDHSQERGGKKADAPLPHLGSKEFTISDWIDRDQHKPRR